MKEKKKKIDQFWATKSDGGNSIWKKRHSGIVFPFSSTIFLIRFPGVVSCLVGFLWVVLGTMESNEFVQNYESLLMEPYLFGWFDGWRTGEELIKNIDAFLVTTNVRLLNGKYASISPRFLRKTTTIMLTT